MCNTFQLSVIPYYIVNQCSSEISDHGEYSGPVRKSKEKIATEKKNIQKFCRMILLDLLFNKPNKRSSPVVV